MDLLGDRANPVIALVAFQGARIGCCDLRNDQRAKQGEHGEGYPERDLHLCES